MPIIAARYGGSRSSAYHEPARSHLFFAFLSQLMSQHKHAWFKFDPLKNPSESFLDYLEGYASSMDMFPVCSRREEQPDDIGSVVDNFWRISLDLKRSSSERKLLLHEGTAKARNDDVEAERRK